MIALADLPGRPCPIAATMEVVGDRWSLLIVRELAFGLSRFNEIAVHTGAPRDRLAARLRDLVGAGVVERRPYQETPPRFDYVLTESGRDLVPVLESLLAWGNKWAIDPADPERRKQAHAPPMVATSGGAVRAAWPTTSAGLDPAS